MATRTIERYKDGVLISSEVVEVEDDVQSTHVEVPREAVTQLAQDMADPAINSIAEIKSAITNFVDQIK